MNGFDYFILLILGASAVLGFVRGFIKELLSLVAYVVAFMVTIWWGPDLSLVLGAVIEQDFLRTLVAYVAVFILTLLGVGLINMSLRALIDYTGLGSADHGLGLFFGLLRGVVLIVALSVAAGYTQLPMEPWWQQSQLMPIAITIIHSVKSYLPPDLASWLPY